MFSIYKKFLDIRKVFTHYPRSVAHCKSHRKAEQKTRAHKTSVQTEQRQTWQRRRLARLGIEFHSGKYLRWHDVEYYSGACAQTKHSRMSASGLHEDLHEEFSSQSAYEDAHWRKAVSLHVERMRMEVCSQWRANASLP